VPHSRHFFRRPYSRSFIPLVPCKSPPPRFSLTPSRGFFGRSFLPSGPVLQGLVNFTSFSNLLRAPSDRRVFYNMARMSCTQRLHHLPFTPPSGSPPFFSWTLSDEDPRSPPSHCSALVNHTLLLLRVGLFPARSGSAVRFLSFCPFLAQFARRSLEDSCLLG